MDSLNLNLSDLDVDSFTTDAASDEGGTVHGQAVPTQSIFTCQYPCPNETREYTNCDQCGGGGGTNYDTCFDTCANTCGSGCESEPGQILCEL
jgi:hypothetical protein